MRGLKQWKMSGNFEGFPCIKVHEVWGFGFGLDFSFAIFGRFPFNTGSVLFELVSYPIPSMYGIFTICHKNQPNVGIYMPYMEPMGYDNPCIEVAFAFLDARENKHSAKLTCFRTRGMPELRIEQMLNHNRVIDVALFSKCPNIIQVKCSQIIITTCCWWFRNPLKKNTWDV